MARKPTVRAKRWAAMLVIAAVCAAWVPGPARAAEHPCHRPVSQSGWQSAEHDCGAMTHAACFTMSGCTAVTAVTTAPDAGFTLSPPNTTVLEPVAAMVHDLAPRGPPTPPPDN